MSQSVLEPPRQSLALPLVVALLGHVIFGGAALGISALQDRNRTPIVQDFMEVSMVIKPRSSTKMPEKATRAPVPKGETMEKTAAPDAAPPPPVSSDLTFQDPNAKAQTNQAKATPDTRAQGAPDRSADREKLLREMTMKALVDETAAEGKVDRQATDPDSTSDEGINTGGSGPLGDAELARYQAKIQALFKPHFKPLPTITAANPKMFAIIHLDVDLSTGEIQGFSLRQSSGNASYDSAAERAAGAVQRLPLPPEKFVGRYTNGYDIKFTPP